MSNKNEIQIEAIVTSGTYKLEIYDNQNAEVRDYLDDTLRLKNIPFTFFLESMPVL